jgi:hypothetical protein
MAPIEWSYFCHLRYGDRDFGTVDPLDSATLL